ncbi:hypothetical protein KY343_06045, partial [Candidatus Woesearchaeota archaeon]|nr:hypothetical protein [Candidatus Woesearchaeota archaeon]
MRKEILEEIGLTKSEINVYLALLELGSTTTGKIVDKSKASSSKIYEILDKLMQKGLVSYIIKSGVKYFEAAAPERIMDYMKEKERKFNSQKDELKKILPELELKRKLSKYKSEATIFKGVKGMETAFYDALNLLKPRDEHLAFGIPKRSEQVSRFFLKFNKERARRKIKNRIIFTDEVRKDPKTVQQTYPKNNPLAKVKFTKEVIPASIDIFNNRIVIFPSEVEEPLIIVIDNKEIAESFRVQFEKWWDDKVKNYEGNEGFKAAFGDIISTLKKGDKLSIMGIFDFDSEFREMIIDFHKKRSEKGIEADILLNYGAKGIGNELKRLSNTRIKYLQKGMVTPSVFLIYGNKVLISLPNQRTFFSIDNKEAAESFKVYFNTLWDQRVQTYQGQDQIEAAMNSLIEQTTKKEDVIVFAAEPVTKEGADYNVKWNKEIRQKARNVRLLYYGDNEKNRKRAKEIEEQGCETKIYPTEQTLPISTIVQGNTVMNAVWSKNPSIFKIENKTVADSLRTNFDLLWNQEVMVLRGIKGVHNAWNNMLDELEPGEEYYVMGASWRGQKKEVYDYFIDFHQRRQQKGVKVKFLFVHGTEKLIEKHKDIYKVLSEVKYLPPNVYEGIQFNLYKNKVLIFVWREKEPIVFSITDEKIYHTFKTYFDSLWGQETKTLRG